MQWQKIATPEEENQAGCDWGSFQGLCSFEKALGLNSWLGDGKNYFVSDSVTCDYLQMQVPKCKEESFKNPI